MRFVRGLHFGAGPGFFGSILIYVDARYSRLRFRIAGQ
jgi:hypothetical protein